jgi:hypothetical protein
MKALFLLEPYAEAGKRLAIDLLIRVPASSISASIHA